MVVDVVGPGVDCEWRRVRGTIEADELESAW